MGNKCLHSPVLNRLNYPFTRGRTRTGVSGLGNRSNTLFNDTFSIRSNWRTGSGGRHRDSNPQHSLHHTALPLNGSEVTRFYGILMSLRRKLKAES